MLRKALLQGLLGSGVFNPGDDAVTFSRTVTATRVSPAEVHSAATGAATRSP